MNPHAKTRAMVAMAPLPQSRPQPFWHRRATAIISHFGLGAVRAILADRYLIGYIGIWLNFCTNSGRPNLQNRTLWVEIVDDHVVLQGLIWFDFNTTFEISFVTLLGPLESLACMDVSTGCHRLNHREPMPTITHFWSWATKGRCDICLAKLCPVIGPHLRQAYMAPSSWLVSTTRL